MIYACISTIGVSTTLFYTVQHNRLCLKYHLFGLSSREARGAATWLLTSWARLFEPKAHPLCAGRRVGAEMSENANGGCLRFTKWINICLLGKFWHGLKLFYKQIYLTEICCEYLRIFLCTGAGRWRRTFTENIVGLSDGPACFEKYCGIGAA